MFDPHQYLASVSSRPGVYLMSNQHSEILYVGKAKNLKRRLSSYFTAHRPLEPKTKLMLQHVADIRCVVTQTEQEALLLEYNLIKRHKPRYNIIFRDDKSYPYLCLSRDTFPRLFLYRGRKRKDAEYFGPYPSSQAAKSTLRLLQRIFHLRTCRNAKFQHRTRPCLQFQIKRCEAPCVEHVTAPHYQHMVQAVRLFLSGKSDRLIRDLMRQMEAAAAQQHYELAVVYRDQIQALQTVQHEQCIEIPVKDLDVLAVVSQEQVVCVACLMVRGGRLLGERSFFPKHVGQAIDVSAVLEAFILQHYLRQPMIPTEILCNHSLPNATELAAILVERIAHPVHFKSHVRGKRRQLMQTAVLNAQVALKTKLAATRSDQQKWEALASVLGLSAIHRVECFDVSHTQGEATVASCVVFDSNGPSTDAYRRFNIVDITPGDDVAAISQAVRRRYQKMPPERLPTVLIIDGGQGQLRSVRQVLADLAVSNIALLGVAKGPAREAGHEKLYLAAGPDIARAVRERPLQRFCDGNSNTRGRRSCELAVPLGHPVRLLIQHIRDEAHRFAVAGHRRRRAKVRKTSALEEIPGIGAKRRQQLLRYFGGIKGVQQAGIADLVKVAGVSRHMAERIHQYLHG